MAQLINTANAAGVYQTMEVTDTTQAIVELSAISIVKGADRQIWVNDDELTYTIVVTNLDERPADDPDDPGDPVTDTVITDTIDPAIATLVDGSVTINGAAAVAGDYDFDASTGELTVRVGTMQAGGSATITFRVEKV